MEKGLRVEGNEKIGKTIIFAKSHKHAQAIVERFNKLYPELGGNFAKVIDYSINYVDSIIDDFSDKNKESQIAISVDMLDTGIDIPEILNLVFFKKVRSKTKFWQMIGRGTRLCPDLLGIGHDKEGFLIFDFCNNFDFFRANPKGFEGKIGETLSERIFNLKVNLIKEYISPLITSLKDDELAKRFDLVMYIIELANLQGNNATKPIKSVIDTAEQLSKLGTIPQVQEQKYIIDKVRTEEFWEDVDIFELDEVRQALRELLKYLEKENQKIYYTNFDDFVINEESNGAMYNVNNLKNYRKKVEYYLKEHENELAIYKLKNNKQLTKQDLKTLESIMWSELGTQADYEKEFGDMSVNKLVRKLVGLDRTVANEVFSEFLSSQELNTKQIHFVKLIIDYIVKNGFIDDNRVLTEDPFRTVGNLSTLFKENINDAKSIMNKVAEIKKNAEAIV